MRLFVTILFLIASSTFGATPTGAVPPRVNSNPVTQEYDATWWGASTNSLDNSSAINQAIAYVSSVRGGVVRIPTGTFTVSSRIDPAKNVMLKGSGMGATTLIFTNMTTPTGAFMWAQGSTSIITAVQSSDISAGSQTVTFGSDPGLAVGDVYFVLNPTSRSFSGWRAEYQQGEAFEVHAINGNTVTNTSLAFASYTGTNNVFYKMTGFRFGLEGMTIIFPSGISAPGLRISVAQHVLLKDLELRNGLLDQIFVDRCYDVVADNIRVFDHQGSTGNNYGLIIGNSQNIWVSHYNGATTRHTFATGGGSTAPNIPTRNLFVSDSILGSQSLVFGVPGCNTHGNIEYAYWNNCAFYAGFEAGGNHQYFSGCFFGNGETSSRAFVTSEISGWDFVLSNPTIRASRAYDFGLIALNNQTNVTTAPGTFVIKGGTIDGGSYGTTTYPTDAAKLIGITGVFGHPAGTETIKIDIQGVTFNANLAAGPSYAVKALFPSTNGVTQISIKDCTMTGAGIYISPNVDEVFILRNEIADAPEFGIQSPSGTFSHTNMRWHVEGNKIRRSQKYGASIQLDTAGTTLWFEKNLSINNGQALGVGRSSWTINGPGVCYLYGNFYGDDQAIATQTEGFSLLNIMRLFRGFNMDVGIDIHPLAINTSAITDDLGWIPSRSTPWNFGTPTATHTNVTGETYWNLTAGNGAASNSWLNAVVSVAPSTFAMGPPVSHASFIGWDYDNLGIAMGGLTTGGYGFPFNLNRSTNSLVAWIFSNKQASGNTATSAGIEVIGGASGNDSAVVLRAYADDHSNANLKGKGGLEVLSSASALYLSAPTAGQTIDLSNGGTATGAQFKGGTNLDVYGTISMNSMVVTNGGVYVITLGNGTGINLAASTTYYEAADWGSSANTTYSSVYAVVPKSGTIKRCEGLISYNNTPSGETVNHDLFINGTTAVSVQNVVYGASRTRVSNTALSTAVVAGDQIAVRITTPAWTTAPTSVRTYFTLLIE